MLPQLSTVLVKPAGPDCNQACCYCFYSRRQEMFPGQPRMSDAVLVELVRQLVEQGSDQIAFVWQGGEPTLMGLPFYEAVVGLQQRYRRAGQTIANDVQSQLRAMLSAWLQQTNDPWLRL